VGLATVAEGVSRSELVARLIPAYVDVLKQLKVRIGTRFGRRCCWEHRITGIPAARTCCWPQNLAKTLNPKPLLAVSQYGIAVCLWTTSVTRRSVSPRHSVAPTSAINPALVSHLAPPWAVCLDDPRAQLGTDFAAVSQFNIWIALTPRRSKFHNKKKVRCHLMFTAAQELGVPEVQVQEPVLTLPHAASLEADFKKTFEALSVVGVPLHLVTMYDDIGDAYPWVVQLPVQVRTFD